MRATLLWTIHDYPGFGNMSVWRIKGYHSCYTCNDEPYLEVLESKIGFLTIKLICQWNIVGDIFDCIMVYRRNGIDLYSYKWERYNRMPNIILGKHPSNKKTQLIREPN